MTAKSMMNKCWECWLGAPFTLAEIVGVFLRLISQDVYMKSEVVWSDGLRKTKG